MHYFVALIAATPSPSVPFDITQALQFGFVGVVLLCMVFRKYIIPEWTLKDQEARSQAEKAELSKRLDETREQLEKLQSVFQEQMIPALTRSTEINTKYTDELQKARYVRKPPTENE